MNDVFAVAAVLVSHAVEHYGEDVDLIGYDGPGHGNFSLYNEFATRYRELEFPDLMESCSGPLGELSDQTRLLDERLRLWQRQNSVDLSEIRSLEELRESL